MPVITETKTEKFCELLKKINYDPTYFNGEFALLSPADKRYKYSHTITYFNQDPSVLVNFALNWETRHSYHRAWYMSINSFRNRNRSEQYIRRFNGFYLDIDCQIQGSATRGNVHADQADFYINLPKILEVANLPDPTLLIDSGHGFYPMWLLSKNFPNNDSKGIMISKWSHIERRLAKAMNKGCQKVLGTKLADPNATDPSRVLRIPLTTNAKRHPFRKCNVQWIYPNNLYFLSYWSKRFPAPKNKHFKKHYSKHYTKHQIGKYLYSHKYKINFGVPHHHSLKTLLWSELLDLNQYLKDHHYNLHDKVYRTRELFLFLYATISCRLVGNPYQKNIKPKVADKVVSYLAEKNKAFKDPLPQCEIDHLNREIRKPRIASRTISKDSKHKYHNFTHYYYSIDTIIETLGITPKEQKNMRVLITGNEKAKRHLIDKNKARNKKRQARKKKSRDRRHRKLFRNHKVIDLYKIKHLTYRAIAKIIKISKSTVGNIIKGISKITSKSHRHTQNRLSKKADVSIVESKCPQLHLKNRCVSESDKFCLNDKLWQAHHDDYSSVVISKGVFTRVVDPVFIKHEMLLFIKYVSLPKYMRISDCFANKSKGLTASMVAKSMFIGAKCFSNVLAFLNGYEGFSAQYVDRRLAKLQNCLLMRLSSFLGLVVRKIKEYFDWKVGINCNEYYL